MRRPFDTSFVHSKQQLAITVSDIAADTILCMLIGDLDLATTPQLEEKLAEALQLAPSHLVLDMSEVEFLGSAGLNILTDLRTRQQAAGHHMAIVIGSNDKAARPLRITQLDRVLDLHTELTTAVEACRIRRRPDISRMPQP
ncbi:MAG TPA: STAS domain-containing protein [Pseudonocardiaceae bacterium]